MSRPAPWAKQGGGPGEVDQREGAAAGPGPAGLEQGIVGTGEGQPVQRHQGQRPARDVDALPEAEGGEEARGLVGGELLEEAALGQLPLQEQGVGQIGGQRSRRLLGGPAAGEQGQGAPAGGRDQQGQLLVEGRLGLREPGGRAGGAPRRGARGLGSRRGCPR